MRVTQHKNKSLGDGLPLTVTLNSQQFHFNLNKLSKKTKEMQGLVFTVILSNGGKSLPNILLKLSQKCCVYHDLHNIKISSHDVIDLTVFN